MIRFKKYTQIILGIVLLGSLAQAAQAETFMVTKTTDTADGTCNSDCSLREAVIAANKADGGDSITLPAGTYDLTIPTTSNDYASDDTAAVGDLDVTGNITINGEATNVTVITTSNNSRVFDGHGIDLTLNNLMFDDIKIDVSDVSTDTFYSYGGSVAFMNGGALTMKNCFVRDSHVTAQHSIGGALQLQGSTVNISNSTFFRNRVVSTDGAAYGGAISSLSDKKITITNSTFSNNAAQADPASSTVESLGGVMYIYYSDVGIISSTFGDNIAGVGEQGDSGNQGGAIYNNGGNVTFTNTIVADNSSGASYVDDNCVGTFKSGGYNIDSDQSCALSGTGDLSVDENILLHDINDNGGSTPTRSLGSSSIARDAIPATSANCTSVSEDQRNYARPQNSNCDIGAYEYKDADDDSWVSEYDCDDDNADIYTEQTYYQDQNGNGKGSDVTIAVCSTTPPSGYVEDSGDDDDTNFSNGSIMNVVGAKQGVVSVTYNNNTIRKFDDTAIQYTIFSDAGVPKARLASDGMRVVAVDSLGKNLAVFNGQTGEIYLQEAIETETQKFVTLLVNDFHRKDAVDEIVISSQYGNKLTTSLFVLNPENTVQLKNAIQMTYQRSSVRLVARQKKVLLKSNGVTIKRYRVSFTDMLR